MANMNVAVLIGRLTRDAELRYIASGTAVAKVAIAVNRRTKKGDSWVDETDFFDITIWGKTAENLSQYLVKGKEVAIEGELRLSRWEKDGHKHSRVEIHARNVQLLGGGKDQGTKPASSSQAQGGASWRQPEGSAAPDPDAQGEFDDDIPF